MSDELKHKNDENVLGDETPNTHHASRITHHFSSFDKLVGGVLLALVGLIALTILLGDRVGVTLVSVSPLGEASSTTAIRVQFSETMQRDTLDGKLSLLPQVDGTFRWNASTLIFRPARALDPGVSYTVVLKPGATSDTGRKVLSEYRFTFTVEQPRIAYLYPADATPQNIWLVDLGDPASARQITNSPSGIYDFGVSPDGTRIAFAERNAITGTSDIKMLDLRTGGLVQLTNCADSACTTPVWRPDGDVIAYQRVDYNSNLGGSIGDSPTRVWLIDVTTTPATTRPLFSDLQIVGYNPQWSADGQRIAVYNRDQGILIYDFTDDSLAVVPNRSGSSGALSPDGKRLIFPELVFAEGAQTRSYLKLADLDANVIDALGSPDEPLQDERVVWNPADSRVAVARRYLDDRYTRGYQVYLLDPADGSAQPLTDDPRYANGFFYWDPTGDLLVIQRFPELDENMQPNPLGRPEIWTLDAATKQLTMLAENAFHPRWVP